MLGLEGAGGAGGWIWSLTLEKPLKDLLLPLGAGKGDPLLLPPHLHLDPPTEGLHRGEPGDLNARGPFGVHLSANREGPLGVLDGEAQDIWGHSRPSLQPGPLLGEEGRTRRDGRGWGRRGWGRIRTYTSD